MGCSKHIAFFAVWGLLFLFQPVRDAPPRHTDQPADKADKPPGAKKPAESNETPASSALIRNGDFEELLPTGRPEAWYYLRQARIAHDQRAKGGNYIAFSNQVPGRECQAQQVVRLDGRRGAQLSLSLRVRLHNVQPGQGAEQQPACVISFFDQQWSLLDERRLGPWMGDMEWTEELAGLSVPQGTRTAIVWLGTFGATGEASFDDLEAHFVNPSVLTPQLPIEPNGRLRGKGQESASRRAQ